MKISLFGLTALLSTLCFSVKAQVNASTFSGDDGDFNKPIVANSSFIGTIGRTPSPFNAPTTLDWWSVINIRHRNGALDGPNWGTQLATGLSNITERLFIRGQKNGIWNSWKEVFTAATPRLLVNNATDDGQTVLQVNGGVYAGGIRIRHQASPLGDVLYGLSNASNVLRFGIGYANVESGSNTGSDFSIYAYNDQGGFIRNCLIIKRSTGNVGIGTYNPQARLSVNGDIFAKKVKVTQNPADWPDYVFHPDYELPSLADTEAFIARHRHLPGIPSAAEVEEEGLDLGEMNKKLLEKIEELTLYLIDQQKQLQSQQQRQASLEEEIKDLKSKLHAGASTQPSI